jgi:chromate reductase
MESLMHTDSRSQAEVAALEPANRRLLALPGSLRRRSCNRRLLAAAVELAPPGVDVRVYDDLAAIPPFDEDLEQETGGGPAAVLRLRGEVMAADGLLVATPEYNQSIPGVLKNVLDWLSREAPRPVLDGKPAAVVGATAGRWGTRLAQMAVRHVLYATGALVLPAPALYAAGAERLFDDAGRLSDPATRAQLAAVLAAFAAWIDLVAPRREPA